MRVNFPPNSENPPYGEFGEGMEDCGVVVWGWIFNRY